MAATDTRLVVLAAVSIFGPVNGYQLGRELATWRVQEWAHLRPGSIYQSLSTLESRGLVTRHDLAEGKRTVAVYEITAAGRAEMLELFERALVTVDRSNPLAFHAAIALNGLVDRQTYLELLARRRERLEAESHDWDAFPYDQAPPAVTAGVHLWQQTCRVELAWVEEQLESVAAGEQIFSGEPPWQPPADELSSALASDRARYGRQLGRD